MTKFALCLNSMLRYTECHPKCDSLLVYDLSVLISASPKPVEKTRHSHSSAWNWKAFIGDWCAARISVSWRINFRHTRPSVGGSTRLCTWLNLIENRRELVSRLWGSAGAHTAARHRHITTCQLNQAARWRHTLLSTTIHATYTLDSDDDDDVDDAFMIWCEFFFSFHVGPFR